MTEKQTGKDLSDISSDWVVLSWTSYAFPYLSLSRPWNIEPCEKESTPFSFKVFVVKTSGPQILESGEHNCRWATTNDIYDSRLLSQNLHTVNDLNVHSAAEMFDLLTSGKRYRSITCTTSSHKLGWVWTMHLEALQTCALLQETVFYWLFITTT